MRCNLNYSLLLRRLFRLLVELLLAQLKLLLLLQALQMFVNPAAHRVIPAPVSNFRDVHEATLAGFERLPHLLVVPVGCVGRHPAEVLERSLGVNREVNGLDLLVVTVLGLRSVSIFQKERQKLCKNYSSVKLLSITNLD